jgi:hypothetical protein
MAHPQIVRARIEGTDFTLYYDYDQLRDGKLSQLSEAAKVDVHEEVESEHPGLKMSSIALAGHVEHGEANRFIHIWAYKSLDEPIWNKAREMGVWRPRAGATPAHHGQQDHAPVRLLPGAVGRAKRRRLKKVQLRGDARRRHARRTLCTLSVPPRASTKQMGLFQPPAGRLARKSRRTRLKASGWSRFEECPAPRMTSSLAPGIFLAMYSQGARKGWS